jgi:hypothetical protein
MDIDIKAICKSRGLLSYEMSALLGSCHTTQSKVEASTEHRPTTIAFYWLLQHLPEQAIPTLLDRWLYDKPKNEEQLRVIVKIARRHKKSDEFRLWYRAIRTLHSEFFF